MIYLRNIISLLKNKSFSLFCLTGTILGLIAFYYLFNIVYFEKSFDKFHKESKNIQRLCIKIHDNEEVKYDWTSTSMPFGPVCKNEIPEIDNYVRIATDWWHSIIYVDKDKKFPIDGMKMYYVDSTFFDFFSFNVLKGNKDDLSKPDAVFITRSVSEKYFGKQNPLGKTITVINNKKSYEMVVSGVVEDPPANSHLQFEILLNLKNFTNMFGSWFENAWGFHAVYTYLHFTPDAYPNINTIENKIQDIADIHLNKDRNNTSTLSLQAFENIHLNTHQLHDINENKGNNDMVKILFWITTVIYILIWFNFLIFYSATLINKLKQVAIRKVIGATKLNIFTEVYLTSILVSSIPVVLALIIYPLFHSFLGNVTNGVVMIKYFDYKFFIMLFTFSCLGPLLISFYPAILTSNVNPKEKLLLKGNYRHHRIKRWLNKGVVLIQSVIAFGFISLMLFVQDQVNYMKDKDLGFDLNNIEVIKITGNSKGDNLNNMVELSKELNEYDFIESVCLSKSIPSIEIAPSVIRLKSSSENENISCYGYNVWHNYFETYKHELLAGKFFPDYYTSESKAVVINEKTVNLLGFKSPGDCINRHLADDREIIGVIKNFHHEYSKYEFQPMVFNFSKNDAGYLSIRKTRSYKDFHDIIKMKWEEFFPDIPLEIENMGDLYLKQYKSENYLYNILIFTSILMIIILCLGLSSIVLNDLKKQRKEVSIKKVLGISFFKLSTEIISSYAIVSIIAIILTTPLIVAIVNSWLQSFAFKIELTAGNFIISSMFLIAITSILVGFFSIIMGKVNPAKVLKNE